MQKELLEAPIPTAQHYSFLGPLKGGGVLWEQQWDKRDGRRECILELWDICTECSSKNSQHLLFWHKERKRRGRIQKWAHGAQHVSLPLSKQCWS